MAKKERNRGSVDRARAKRGTTPSSERSRDDDYIYAVPARPSKLAPTSTRDKPVPRPMRTDSMSPSESLRPMTNPRRSDAIDRGNENIRFEQSEQNDVLRGKRFAEGGKVNGFPDLNKDGKVTKADILKGRGAEGFAMGGEVRGCSGSQMSGKGFRGSY